MLARELRSPATGEKWRSSGGLFTNAVTRGRRVPSCCRHAWIRRIPARRLRKTTIDPVATGALDLPERGLVSSLVAAVMLSCFRLDDSRSVWPGVAFQLSPASGVSAAPASCLDNETGLTDRKLRDTPHHQGVVS